ncbi:MAG: FtsX-like permease family protein [Acidobacteria bacterium]|nr:FtsX-like permease family protein [Acidobacteriota bacterium]
MKYLPYLLKHLRRNWIRTTSTVLGMAVCIFLFCTLQTFLAAIQYSLDSASASRLWTRHAVSLVFELPITYKARVEGLPGVRRVAKASWFGGIYDKPENFFANFAVDAEEYLAMSPELMVPDDQRAAFLADRRSALIGRGLANRFGWKIGDIVPLESTIPPYRIGRPFELVVQAIYDTDADRYPGVDMSQLFFHHAYLYEATNRRVQTGMLVTEIDDPDRAGAVIKAIDDMFENTDAQTKTETEGAFVAGFISLAGNLALLLNAIGLAVSFTILLVTANTMSMAVRERRTEIAVLKTLGFSGPLVLGLVLAEALLLGVLGGGLGLWLGWAAIQGLSKVPMLGPVLAGYPSLGLTGEVATLGMGLAVTLGLLAGLLPALSAYRSSITTMLRQV